jgi:hypothetical protein
MMRKKHGIGTFMAIGSLTATVALLTGLPGAAADELADLRANQELLQRRIDQLAQVAPQAAPGTTGGVEFGTRPVPGAALIGGSFPRSFLIPGTETSLRVGGFVDATFTYWFQGGQVNGGQTTNTGANGQVQSVALDVRGQTIPGLATPGNIVPVQPDHSRGNGVFTGSALESRLFAETRTPTSWGEARTYLQFDFAGCDNFSCNGIQHVANPLGKPTRTSPIRTQAAKRSISAAMSGRPASSALRKSVTPSQAPGGALGLRRSKRPKRMS